MSDYPIRYETNELRLLFEVSQALEGATDISSHLDTALELMSRYTGMMQGTLNLLEPNGTDIVVEAIYGPKSSQQKKDKCKVGEGVSGKVIETGKPMLLSKVSEEPIFINRTGAYDLTKEEIALICVPIVINGKVAGALSADRLFADSVRPEEDIRLLQVLASLIARAVKVRLDFHSMHSAVVEENRRLQQMVRGKFHSDHLVASSAGMRSVTEELAHVSGSAATVLLRGESGTGKELAASIIHSNSPRAGRPFIKMNCAALPETLVESELFGHENGAFAGAASARKGRLEMAHGGTLFLDEVADMTHTTQAKLLRVLQEREFERVGGSTAIRVDVRLIAATNRNLENMVAGGQFRQDLYYRLSVFPVLIPPLRERRSDIMPLASHFTSKIGAAHGRETVRITPKAANLLLRYDWPGNIRELENVMERAVILSSADGIIDAHHLPAWVQDSGRRYTSLPASAKLEDALGALEKRLIMDALEACGGNMAKAAGELGISERIMGLRMKKYGLDYKLFRKVDYMSR